MADMTPNQIAANLISLGKELVALVKHFRDLELAAAEAKREYEVAYARSYMAAEGPVEDRKQAAIAETSDKRYMADLADREIAACKEAIKALHARIEIGRTLSATVRDEVKLAGVGT
jgi:cell division septum initiation protein DivIVA